MDQTLWSGNTQQNALCYTSETTFWTETIIGAGSSIHERQHMSSITQGKTSYKHQTAAQMTVFGLVSAAILACPNLEFGKLNTRLLIQWGELALSCACFAPLFFLAPYMAIRGFKRLMTERRDERNLLNGEQWARWQYAPGEWQQSFEAKHSAGSGVYPSPWVILGPYGVYNQAMMFKSIRNLRSVNYQPAKAPSDPDYYLWGNMSRLELVLRDTYTTRWGGRGGVHITVGVGVPHGKEAEAVAIMNRFINERLQDRNG